MRQFTNDKAAVVAKEEEIMAFIDYDWTGFLAESIASFILSPKISWLSHKIRIFEIIEAKEVMSWSEIQPMEPQKQCVYLWKTKDANDNEHYNVLLKV